MDTLETSAANADKPAPKKAAPKKSKKKDSDTHKGHRERLKRRFRDHGLDSFEDHNVLELLLCYAKPRVDVNPLAHDLMKSFGSLPAVFDAPPEELLKVDGVGENTVLLIKFIIEAYRRYVISGQRRDIILNTYKKAGDFILPYFIGEREEVVYMMCLDAKCKLLNCKLMARGGVNAAEINTPKIVEQALRHKATSVVLAHNHTSGLALPSHADMETTKSAANALRTVDIILFDHIIAADNDYVSMAETGFIRAIT